jgi:hypothetical protein
MAEVMATPAKKSDGKKKRDPYKEYAAKPVKKTLGARAEEQRRGMAATRKKAVAKRAAAKKIAAADKRAKDQKMDALMDKAGKLSTKRAKESY